MKLDDLKKIIRIGFTSERLFEFPRRQGYDSSTLRSGGKREGAGQLLTAISARFEKRNEPIDSKNHLCLQRYRCEDSIDQLG